MTAPLPPPPTQPWERVARFLVADDFYYVASSNGSRLYYARFLGSETSGRTFAKPVKQSQIPPHLCVAPLPAMRCLARRRNELQRRLAIVRAGIADTERLTAEHQADLKPLLERCPNYEQQLAMHRAMCSDTRDRARQGQADLGSDDVYVRRTGRNQTYCYSRLSEKRITRAALKPEVLAVVEAMHDVITLPLQVEKLSQGVEALHRRHRESVKMATEIVAKLNALPRGDDAAAVAAEDEACRLSRARLEAILLARKSGDTSNGSNTKGSLFSRGTHDPRRTFLERLGIMSKPDWRTWLKHHHPDKGGENPDLCSRVISLGKEIYAT